jgi:hypothetical protein
LGRLKSNQAFYKPAPPRTGKSGQPRKDGEKLKLDNVSTQKNPDEIWNGKDAKGHPVQICWWNKMHAEKARWLELTIIQVVRPRASGSERDPRMSWFAYRGLDPEARNCASCTSLWFTGCSKNMGIDLTNKLYFGLSHVCARQNSSIDGLIS